MGPTAAYRAPSRASAAVTLRETPALWGSPGVNSPRSHCCCFFLCLASKANSSFVPPPAPGTLRVPSQKPTGKVPEGDRTLYAVVSRLWFFPSRPQPHLL